MQAKDAKTRNDTLNSLKLLYAMRFEIDTAYQDYKVREIERRAKALREEVIAREDVAGDWVDAMVHTFENARQRNRDDDTDPRVPVRITSLNRYRGRQPSTRFRLVSLIRD